MLSQEASYLSDKQEESSDFTRRDLFKVGGVLAASAVASPFVTSTAFAAFNFNKGHQSGISREISFRNIHTGEKFSGIYRIGGKYLPDAFDEINFVLRDFRAEEVFPIDPRLLDVVYTLHSLAGTNNPYDIISGYRSPKTNSMLRDSSTGVAKRSLHMTGQAIDIRLPGFSTSELKKIAVNLKVGGVGFYAKSDFVHLDIGRVRTW